MTILGTLTATTNAWLVDLLAMVICILVVGVFIYALCLNLKKESTILIVERVSISTNFLEARKELCQSIELKLSDLKIVLRSLLTQQKLLTNEKLYAEYQSIHPQLKADFVHAENIYKDQIQAYKESIYGFHNALEDIDGLTNRYRLEVKAHQSLRNIQSVMDRKAPCAQDVSLPWTIENHYVQLLSTIARSLGDQLNPPYDDSGPAFENKDLV